MASPAAANGLKTPRIPRLTKEHRQRSQLDYLRWRLAMYLKDYGAIRSDRKKWLAQLDNVLASPQSYEQKVLFIEALMGAHLIKQLSQIQAIYNERTD